MRSFVLPARGLMHGWADASARGRDPGERNSVVPTAGWERIVSPPFPRGHSIARTREGRIYDVGLPLGWQQGSANAGRQVRPPVSADTHPPSPKE